MSAGNYNTQKNRLHRTVTKYHKLKQVNSYVAQLGAFQVLCNAFVQEM